MHIKKKNLYQTLNIKLPILIYGTGLYAKEVYPILIEMGLKKKVQSFVVTHKVEGEDNLDGIPIKSLEEIKMCNLNNFIVLIAVSQKYSGEIKKNLENISVKKIILLEDFLIEEEELKYLSNEQFKQYIEEYNQCYDVIKQKYLNNKFKYIETKIVFLVENLTPRIVKIIGALIRRKINLIFIGYKVNSNNLSKKELDLYNIEYIDCQKIEEMFYLAMQYNPLFYFCEPKCSNCSWTEIMIRHQKLFGKIVISLYDVLNDSYVKAKKEQKDAEKFCLENADGIIWRYFSKEYLEDNKNFIYRGKSIHFLDYCKGYNLKKSGVSEEKKIKICFVVGNIDVFLNDKVPNNYIQCANIQGILKKIGNNEKCEFHCYAGKTENKYKDICNTLEEKYNNFKVYYDTSHEKLIDIISEYDYGCLLYTEGKAIKVTETVDNIYYGSVYINSVANRYFDYLDAGLPIIANRPIKIIDFLDQYGVVVKMDLSNIDLDFLIEKKEIYKARVKDARNDLIIDNHISRLIKFFEEL